MEKQELMNKYELVLIIDAKLPQDEKELILKQAKYVVAKSGAKVINSQVWLEKQKFTFEIRKNQEGTYYLINVEGGSSSIDKIRKELKLNERILRSSFSKI